MSDLSRPGVVRAYALLLPPGWVRLPVSADSDRLVAELFDELVAGAPRDKVAPFRAELEKMVLAHIAAAREIGGLDVYLPIAGLRGRAAAASFVVCQLPPPSGDEAVAMGKQGEAAVLAEILERSGDAARAVELAAGPAVRIESVADADASVTAPGGAAIDRRTRRVDYAVAVPDGGGWLSLAFSTLELRDEDNPSPPGADGPRFDDLLVELFDAIVTTLRWR